MKLKFKKLNNFLDITQLVSDRAKDFSGGLTLAD